jgi:hypothetical protein
VLLPLVLGPALGDALSDRSRAVAVAASVMAWLVWAGVLVAVLLPTTMSLTALRIAAPVALAVADWAALTGPGGAAALAAVAGTAVVLVTAFSPLTGHAFVNGSAYGDERRYTLRVPAALLLGPILLTEAAAVIPPIAGVLLLACRLWVAGLLVLGLGLPLAAGAVWILHGLARRWVVFVPAGFVLHDPHTMIDPVLFPRETVRSLGPAPAPPSDTALDLSQRALGLLLQLHLQEPVELAPRRGAKAADLVTTDTVLFAVTRPGPMLAEAARRRLPVVG